VRINPPPRNRHAAAAFDEGGRQGALDFIMFDIEHRKGDRAVGREISQSNVLADALAGARRMAAKLDADHLTVTDARGDLIGVFQADFRLHA
jgi:hypothetical protein